jgi:predicted nucleotidyltransferase
LPIAIALPAAERGVQVALRRNRIAQSVMLAERPLPQDLDHRIRELAKAWANDPDIAASYLFGSRARSQPRPRSDVDLAVVLREGLDDTERYRKRLDLTADACRRLGTDAVDLIVLEDAPAALGHRVIAHGVVLSDREPRRRVQVVEWILRRYLDEGYLRRMLDEGLARRVREGRFAR